MKRNLRPLIFYALILAVFLLIAQSLFSSANQSKLSYSQVVGYFYDEQVKEYVINGSKIQMLLQDDTVISYGLPSLDLFLYDVGDTIREQQKAGIIQNYDYVNAFGTPWWEIILPYAIIIVMFVVFWVFLFNQTSGAGKGANAFGKARTKQAQNMKNKVMFSDVAGAEEEKEELTEVVDFLKTPGKYLELGARIPKGVLLVGPPGTGKTLLAKAVAGEAGVPFFSISGSDFVELYVGVGASRVRDLFDQAKRSAPCIIFIDEIDAVGRQRGAGLGGGHDEREQTLNQMLVEMDGFSINEGVIVIAATNRADILDPALLRPGRFDRRVTIGYPDVKGREQILKVHSRKKPLESDVNLSVIAKTTVGFTGADLENLLNEASLLAARSNKHTIGMREIEEASIKVIMGPEKKSRVITEAEKRLVAYHEAGHAVVSRFLPLVDPVHEISIIPRGQAGGYTMYRPSEDRSYMSRTQMFQEIVSFLGGWTSEKMILDDHYTGTSNDIERATTLARKMVTKYGMSDNLGPINYDTSEEVFLGRDLTSTRTVSEKLAAAIDDEVKNIFDRAVDKCREILGENIDKLHTVAQMLIGNEKITSQEFDEIFNAPNREEATADFANGTIESCDLKSLIPNAAFPENITDTIDTTDTADSKKS